MTGDKPGTARVDLGRSPVALVNNMPDSAFVETEEQFRQVTACAPNGARIDLYTITEIPRSEAVTSVIQARYRGLDELWAHPPDALIVTGTEPKCDRLDHEPYWPQLARLMEWAANSVPTTLLSCLAPTRSLCCSTGLSACGAIRSAAACSKGSLPTADICLPEDSETGSGTPFRLNGVPEAELVRAGYEIVIGSGPSRAGWAVATCQRGNGQFVLCQGHPEYGALSLLREYRRDVRRSLLGTDARPYPRLPEGYLAPEAAASLNDSNGERPPPTAIRRISGRASPMTKWPAGS